MKYASVMVVTAATLEDQPYWFGSLNQGRHLADRAVSSGDITISVARLLPVSHAMDQLITESIRTMMRRSAYAARRALAARLAVEHGVWEQKWEAATGVPWSEWQRREKLRPPFYAGQAEEVMLVLRRAAVKVLMATLEEQRRLDAIGFTVTRVAAGSQP